MKSTFKKALILVPSLLLHLLAGLFTSGCKTLPPPTTENPPNLQLHEQTLALEDGSTLTYERGVLRVPLRRDHPRAKTIEIEFHRFRSTATNPAPPIFQLKGGPGFEGLGRSLSRPGYFEGRLAGYTKIADLIVPGQRGFGTSGATPCEPMEELSLQQAFDLETRSKAMVAALSACRAKWEEQGLDLTGFNAIEAAADLADIAAALGYDQIQLLGNSFGTHWGMATQRFHPRLVARATYGALEGPDHTYDHPSSRLAALERIMASAERSPELRDQIPTGGMANRLRELLRQADAQPITVTVPHPETGDPVTVDLSAQDIRDMPILSRTVFSIHWPRWAPDMLALLNGDYEEATTELIDRRLGRYLPDAAYYQLDCGSGISSARHQRYQHDPANEIFGRFSYDLACPVWDADLGDDFRLGFSTDIPTLLVHGTWDTATPYTNALDLLPRFANHRFVHVDGGSHGALREAVEQVEGFQEALNHWFASGDFGQLPTRAALQPVPWTAERTY